MTVGFFNFFMCNPNVSVNSKRDHPLPPGNPWAFDPYSAPNSGEFDANRSPDGWIFTVLNYAIIQGVECSEGRQESHCRNNFR